jgi:hypothetical protein
MYSHSMHTMTDAVDTTERPEPQTRRARLAVATDHAEDLERLIAALDSSKYELVGAIVMASELLMARHLCGLDVRCATHPDELHSLGIDVVATLRGDDIWRRHGARLQALPVTIVDHNALVS